MPACTRGRGLLLQGELAATGALSEVSDEVVVTLQDILVGVPDGGLGLEFDLSFYKEVLSSLQLPIGKTEEAASEECALCKRSNVLIEVLLLVRSEGS